MNRLERVKTFVEILAIVGAGTWAAFEFGFKEREQRLEGQELRRAILKLDAEAARIDRERSLIHARLTVSNTSKRSLTTFLTSWWVTYPPEQGYGSLGASHIINDPTHLDLAPGEESQLAFSKIVDPAHRAAVVHAVVMFSPGDDEQCDLVPGQAVPDGGVASMTSQPRVCLRRVNAMGDEPCKSAGCPAQAVERLVLLEAKERQ